MPIPQKLDGKQIDRLRVKQLTEPCLSPLVGDGEHTKKLLAEIQGQIKGLEVEGYRDLLPQFRAALRTARYLDWQAARK